MTRWTLAGCMALAALSALALSVGVAEAGKPGGGGPIPPGTGTIYFNSGDEHDGPVWSMNADGSGKTALPTSVRGVPSNQMHGGARWFLSGTYGNYGPVHAIREDGSSDVQLFSEDTVFPWSAPVWGADDSFVSFMWRDVAAGSAYRLARIDIDFDANGVPSAAGGPVAVSGIAANHGLAHAWSPSGDRVAWMDGYNLNVTTVATGATTAIASYGRGGGVAWSPDGARIQFGSDGGIDTIDPSGANRRIIVQHQSGGGGLHPTIVSTVATGWSPDSAAIVYGRNVTEWRRATRGYPGYYELADVDVYRASADGSATQNLTSELSSQASPTAWR